MLKSHEIRQSFIEFFEKKAHTFVPSSPVAPLDDPTLLFTNAGMNQYKDIFLGTNPKHLKRAVNSQACIRVSGKHNDLEDVGYDGTHLTLFEMLGNWSFGDYYKKEAIVWAWEFLTEVHGLPKERLYATVYETDDEAFELWKSETDIRHDHILRFGKKDNFWEMGDVGPCGPCSEIHMDLGPDDGTALSTDPVLGVNGENDRFIEFWNLVFIQYDRQPDGELADLTHKHVDTGMGLERLTAYLQGTRSNYETDLIYPIIEKISALSGVPYHTGESGVAHRVMADHIRMLVFTIAGNVLPSNEGRGYVLRRLLRRALRYATQIGIKEPVMYQLVAPVVEIMSVYFEELGERQEFIETLIKAEEESFLRTLSSGIERFNGVVEGMKSSGQTIVSGGDVFKLYDTFGFPADLTALMAREQGLDVDMDGFEAALDEQRQRSRDRAKKEHYEVIDESAVDLEALAKDMPTLLHSPHQTVARGGEARIVSSYDDKLAMARHHTATHLLQSALRDVLGDHAHQAGSLVDTSHLRFDFTHFQGVSDDDLARIESIVLSKIEADLPVVIREMSLDEAKDLGAMALFGEKYDADCVRVVDIGGYSIELCGGTHVCHTGMVESFKLLTEAAISAGTRRIEAIAGNEAIQDYYDKEAVKLRSMLSGRLSQVLQQSRDIQAMDSTWSPPTVVESLDDMDYEALVAFDAESVALLKSLDKTLQKLKAKAATQDISVYLDAIDSVGDTKVGLLAQVLDGFDMSMMRTLSDQVLSSHPDTYCVFGGGEAGKAFLFVRFPKGSDVSIKAGDVIQAMTAVAGGKGGGRPDMAQAGGVDYALLESAVTAGKEFLLDSV